MQYQLSVLDPNEQQVALTTISIPARSNSAKFIDELVRLPNDFGGTAFITSTSNSLSVVGLVFNGSVFFSQPAVTFGPTAQTPPVVASPGSQALTGVYYLREYTTFCCDFIPAVAATGHFVPPFRLRGSSGDASDPIVTGGMLELRSDFTFSLLLDLQDTANGTNASWQANGTYTAPRDGVVGPEFELRSPAFWYDGFIMPGTPTWDEYVRDFGDPRTGSVSIHDGDLSLQFNFKFGERVYKDSGIFTFRR